MTTFDLAAAVCTLEAFAVEEFIANRDGGAIVPAHQDFKPTRSAVSFETTVIFEAWSTVKYARNTAGVVETWVANSISWKWCFAARAELNWECVFGLDGRAKRVREIAKL